MDDEEDNLPSILEAQP